MTYSFANSDALITHIQNFAPSLRDRLLQQRYAGIVCVISAAAFEVAIKQILCEFAQKKHKVLGAFADAYFDALNGRIKLKDVREVYVQRFGGKYLVRFDRELAKLEQASLVTNGKSPKASYGNLIVWRHQFAHEGNVPVNATFQEAVDSYGLGKEIIHCLARCMTR